MRMNIPWTSFKEVVTAKQLSIHYIDTYDSYYLTAYDNRFEIRCQIPKVSPASSDQSDFETNYKNLDTTNMSLWQNDTDGAQIVRIKAAKKGWTYCAMPFEFQTARLSDTLFSQDNAGNTRNWITLKAYNAQDEEVTTAGLLNANYATIVKTVIDFEPPFDYEVIGGNMRTVTDITSDMRMWIVAVPDIPANLGGSKEMASGINLRYLTPGNEYIVDGRVSKFLTYNATYHTNKLRLIIKYPAGTNEFLSTVIEMYRA